MYGLCAHICLWSVDFQLVLTFLSLLGNLSQAVFSSSSVYSFELCLMRGTICLSSENIVGWKWLIPGWVCHQEDIKAKYLYGAFHFLFVEYFLFTKSKILQA